MDRNREGMITEKLAEALARCLPNVHPLAAASPDTASRWPNDWGAAELAMYRAAAVEAMQLVKPLFSDVPVKQLRGEREKPFFVRAETLPNELQVWLRSRSYHEQREALDRAGNLMFCLRTVDGELSRPGGLVIVTAPDEVPWVRSAIIANMAKAGRV